MKPGHIASSAVDYLARKKGLILNSSDISKTILANVEAAEHKGVLVPEGTTVGYVLTVQDNMSSGWQVSTGDLLLISPNIWEKRQEFRTPPVVTYAYNDYSSTSTQIPTTQVVHNIIDTKIQSAGLNQLLSLDSVAYNKSMTLQSSTRTSTWSSSELSIGTTISSTIYSMNRLQTNGLYTISSPLQGITVEGKVYFDSGVTFAVSPQSNADPIVGNDLATKAYVDTLIGNYSGTGVNLYMNTGGVLGTVIGSGSGVIETTGITESTFIAEFTTPANYPNTTVIPSGIWNMTLYGNLNLDTKIIKYYFELWKVTEGGIETHLQTSGEGEDVNTLSSIPEIHRINLSLTEPHTILVSDRLRIKIYAKSSDSEGVTLNTFFGGDYYSYLTTSLSGGLSILTMTNNFTATNKFIQEIKAEGGITTTTVFGTQMVATSISTGSLSSNSMSVVGAIVSNGGVETTTLQTSGLITSSNGILATGNGISVTGGGISTTSLNSVGLITAQNGVIISGGLTVSGADGITTTKLYASGLITASHGNGITTTQLYTTGRVTFGGGYSPICNTLPELDDWLTNKKYVDTLVDNYTDNGLRMYLTKPVTFNPNPITASSTYELNPKVQTDSYDTITKTGTGSKVLLASFVTDVYSVDTAFPAGRWSIVIYQVASVASGSSTYTFTLNQSNNVGEIVGNQIGNESIEAININSASAYLKFRSSTFFDSFTIPANTRLRLNLYVNVPSGVTAYTVFGGIYGSYVQTPLPITSAPNTWTGKNTFLAGITVSGATATFTTYTPQCSIESTIDSELTNKAYVDKNMVSYTGNGLSMYFNIKGTTPIVNPMTSPITYELNPIISPVSANPSATYYTLQTTGAGTKTLIASFITSQFKSSFDVQEGIWSMVLYGAVSSSTGTATYSFQILKTDSSLQNVGTIGSESSSTIDVNALSSVAPGMYQCSTRVPSSSSIQVNYRIKVNIYATVPSGVALYTYFGGIYSSYMKTTLPITTTNNTWLGENTFSGVLNASGFLAASNGISVQTINATNTGTAVSLYTGQTAGTITIGSANSNVTVTSPLTTSSTLTTSGLLDASGGLTTGKSIYAGVLGTTSTATIGGALTASSTISASGLITASGGLSSDGLITASHVNGITTTTLYSTGRITSNYIIESNYNNRRLEIGSGHLYMQTSSLNVTALQLDGDGLHMYPTANLANGQLNIGNDTNTNRIGSLDIVGATLDNKDTANVLNLGTNQIGGILNLGTNPGRTGAINIGATSCAVNVYGKINSSQGVSTNSVDALTSSDALTLGTGGTSLILKGGSSNIVSVTLPVNLTVPDQSAGANNSNTANTKFVTGAISALSSVYATISSLSDYVTNSSLSGYVTNSSLTSTLSGYITLTTASSTLTLYAQKAVSNTWNLLQTFSSGVATTTLNASGLITASGGIGSTHIYYTTQPTSIYSIGYRKNISGNFNTADVSGVIDSATTGSLGNTIKALYTFSAGTAGAMIGVWLYEVTMTQDGQATVNYLSVSINNGTSLPSTHHETDKILQTITTTNVGTQVMQSIRLICTKAIITDGENMYVLISTHSPNYNLETGFKININCTRLA